MAFGNSYLHRKILLIAIDLLAIVWIIHEMFFAPAVDDFFGLFLLVVISGILIFNLYAILLIKFFFGKGRIRFYIEGLYVFLLILPILVLWHFTH